jgi:P4 family phage/plasmid primase-like protien
MTEISDSKKKEYYKKTVIDFLNKNKYNDEIHTTHTHSSYGSVLYGTFFISDADIKIFMEHYTNAIIHNVTDLSILEKQKEFSPIIVDIDLKKPSDNFNPNKKLYNSKLINKIIKKYIIAIKTYLKCETLEIFLFEKSQSKIANDNNWKDGFHIIFPTLCVEKKIRHLIRDHVVKLCDKENVFESYINNADIIIDKAVVSSNGWFLYGSGKPGDEKYKLTKVYDINLNQLENDSNDSDIIRYLSFYYNRKKYDGKKATPLNDDYNDSDIEAEIQKNNININPKSNDLKYRTENKEILIKRACKYASMLSKERAKEYEDWRNVGLALHSIDSSLLHIFDAFSQKCESSYKKAKDGKGGCEFFWKQIKTQSNGNLLTIRSLAYWANQDNPKEFIKFNKEEFKNILIKSMENNTYTIAKAFHTKYVDKYVCSSIKANDWYEFTNHRWVRIEEAHTIKTALSEEFAGEYHKEISELSAKAATAQAYEKDELNSKISKYTKIAQNLMNISYKKLVIEECKSLFYDKNFQEKLDSCRTIIGCNNGVYDLKLRKLRDGQPDDYLSLNTKNDYINFSEKMPYLKNIKDFHKQILRQEAKRKYMLRLAASCVCGDINELLPILTGGGSNGKSAFNDTLFQAFGDYYMSCPITMITRKRGNSNETSPEKVRMKGKRCGIFQETDDGEKLNVGIMKEFTGGDTVLVRDLFKPSSEMIEYKPQMHYFLTCNQLPGVPSNDAGTWRRIRVIDFDSNFVNNPTLPNEFKINTNLKEEIKSWGSTLLSYLIHIYETECQGVNYMEEPPEVLLSTSQYKMENDTYTEYVLSKITKTNSVTDMINQNDLFIDFKNWYRDYVDSKAQPKRPEFIKAANKILGDPIKGRYIKVTFTILEKISENPDAIA